MSLSKKLESMLNRNLRIKYMKLLKTGRIHSQHSLKILNFAPLRWGWLKRKIQFFKFSFYFMGGSSEFSNIFMSSPNSGSSEVFSDESMDGSSGVFSDDSMDGSSEVFSDVTF